MTKLEQAFFCIAIVGCVVGYGGEWIDDLPDGNSAAQESGLVHQQRARKQLLRRHHGDEAAVFHDDENSGRLSSGESNRLVEQAMEQAEDAARAGFQ